jgi:tetratricopeptide (TPR) repeat protein
VPGTIRRRARVASWISLVVAALIVIVAFHGTISDQFHRFVRPGLITTRDLRARLSDPGNNGRIDLWRVAWHQFKAAPAIGHGAGTFQNAWARYRPNILPARDAHSVYLEALDELGVVGLLLLLLVILTVLVAVAVRIRGRGRPLYAAVFALLLGWALHAGVDWDWEMPVVTVVFFALGGFAVARSERRSLEAVPPDPRLAAWTRSFPARAAIGSAAILLAIAPAFVWLSQRDLDRAAYAFSKGDCEPARAAAVSAISTLGNRAEPYEIVSYCDLQQSRPSAALRSIEKAISLDPANWNYRYGLVLMRAASGLDPRKAAQKALALNPREQFTEQAWQAVQSGGPRQWEAWAKDAAGHFVTL